MHKYRNSKPRTRPTNTIDGIINSSSRRPASQPTQQQRHSSYVGNFQQADGFHASERPTIDFQQPSARQPRRGVDGSITLDMPGVPIPSRRKRRRSKGKGERSRKKTILRSLGILFVIVFAVAGLLFANGYLNLRKIFKGGTNGAAALDKDVDPKRLKGEGDGRINILLLGKGGPGHEAPDLTDTILVASIDPVQKEAAILSVPRDFYIPTSTNRKINAVYADAKNKVLNGKKITDKQKVAEEAGLKAIEDKVSATMGIPIHYHALVDFKAFQDAINTVGGIDVKVTKPLSDTLWLSDTGRSYTINVKPGVEHFDGRKALVYSRSRYTSARGDFDRTERQRAIMLALKDKVLSLGTFSNPVKISQLVNNFGSHVQSNMSIDEIKRLYEITKQIDSSKVNSVGLADPPNDYVRTGNVGGSSVVVPKAGLTDYSQIHNYVRNVLKDGFIKKESASILVLNGTNKPGLAMTKGAELKSYGYTVTQTADAPTKNYHTTVVVDMRNGAKKYTKHYLEQRFKTTAVTKLPDNTINPGNADFVIILGQNAVATN